MRGLHPCPKATIPVGSSPAGQPAPVPPRALVPAAAMRRSMLLLVAVVFAHAASAAAAEDSSVPGGVPAVCTSDPRAREPAPVREPADVVVPLPLPEVCTRANTYRNNTNLCARRGAGWLKGHWHGCVRVRDGARCLPAPLMLSAAPAALRATPCAGAAATSGPRCWCPGAKLPLCRATGTQRACLPALCSAPAARSSAAPSAR